MPRRVLECITYDTATATCTQQAFLERENFPELSVADAFSLLAAIAGCFAVVAAYRVLSRIVIQR